MLEKRQELLVKKGVKAATVSTHLEQVSDVPFLADHVVMSLASTNLRGFAVNEDLLNHEPHATKSVLIAILPYRIIVDFMNAVDKTDLKTK